MVPSKSLKSINCSNYAVKYWKMFKFSKSTIIKFSNNDGILKTLEI